MNVDANEQYRASKGIRPEDSFEDLDDSSWFVQGEAVFDPIREDHKNIDFGQQMDNITSKEETERLRAKFDNLQEYQDFISKGGRTAKQLEKDRIINENITRALEEAKEREQTGKSSADYKPLEPESKPLNNEGFKDALALFESDDSTEDLDVFDTDDDIWF